MTRDELEAWLCGDEVEAPTPKDLLALLVGPPGTGDLARLLRAARHPEAARFTVAVLRDVFADDAEVRRWLLRPRGELGGLCALDLIFAGEPRPVEELAVREWHRALRVVAA